MPGRIRFLSPQENTWHILTKQSAKTAKQEPAHCNETAETIAATETSSKTRTNAD